DSDDLPLNVSREMLQKEANVARLRKQIVKRVLDHLQKLADSDEEADRAIYAGIDREFGQVLREGMVNDFENRDKVAKLARWQSTWTLDQEVGEEEQPVTTGLEAYKARMPAGQEQIYYITAPSLASARSAPQLEGYRKKGYEVLFFTAPVDEFIGQHYTRFEDTELVNVLSGDSQLEDEESKEALARRSEEFKPFLDWSKEELDGIKEVRLTSRLTDSPCCIVNDRQGMTTQMEELMKSFGQSVPEQERILELNPDHELVQRLQALHGDEGRRDTVRDHLQVLRDQALLAEGAKIKDQGSFAQRVQRLMAQALG
ncbi:MAG: molecular chaperone HtpG, partial [Planctomycetota bacterium]